MSQLFISMRHAYPVWRSTLTMFAGLFHAHLSRSSTRWTSLLFPIVLFALLTGLNNSFISQHENRVHAQFGLADAFGSGLDYCPAPVEPVVLSNPTVVSDCTQAGLQAALDRGGHIAFACGAAPVSIGLSAPLTVNGTDTVIDGGGLVTLDGQNATKILVNPYVDGGNSLTVQNLRFVNGLSPVSGGLGEESGAAITSGSPGTRLHVINSTFVDNQTQNTTAADNQGGAIFSNNSYETVISGSVFQNNSAGNGGAIGGLATGMLIYNSRFDGNSAVDTSQGGIVRGYGGALHLDGVTNSFNPDSRKELTICGSVFENNTSVRGGGAIGSVVSDNRGTKATFTRSTFTNNEATGVNGEHGQGGAIYHIEDDHAGARSEDNLEISHTTFHNNRAGRQGGAAWLYILGQGAIVNSTFESNRTTAGIDQVGQGGAIAINLGQIDITNVTLANNHADYQGGALHGGGDGDPDRVITLQNTIFYNNTLNEQLLPTETRWQGYHTNRPMTDGGQNIQFPRYKPTYENDVNNNITTNPIYEDPLLQPLADNGGINLTMALGAGSPAIDTGSDTGSGCPGTDQRDADRVNGCDIGAFEAGGQPPAVQPTATPTGGSTATAEPSSTATPTPAVSGTPPTSTPSTPGADTPTPSATGTAESTPGTTTLPTGTPSPTTLPGTDNTLWLPIIEK